MVVIQLVIHLRYTTSIAIMKRAIYSEETVQVNFRVPKSMKPDFVKKAKEILSAYDVRSALPEKSQNDQSAPIDLQSMNPEKKIKNYHGGLKVGGQKLKSECFLIDKFKNLYGDKYSPDDFYVDDPQEGMIQFGNPTDAQRYMNENGIK